MSTETTTQTQWLRAAEDVVKGSLDRARLTRDPVLVEKVARLAAVAAATGGNRDELTSAIDDLACGRTDPPAYAQMLVGFVRYSLGDTPPAPEDPDRRKVKELILSRLAERLGTYRETAKRLHAERLPGGFPLFRQVWQHLAETGAMTSRHAGRRTIFELSPACGQFRCGPRIGIATQVHKFAANST